MSQVTPPIAIQDIRHLNLKIKPTPISEAPEEWFQRLVQIQEDMLKHKYTTMPDTRNHPAYQTYATVVKDGKVIATLDNHGALTTSNAMGAKIRNLPGDINGRTGPVLAQRRAEIIAGQFGGKVVKAATALAQWQFDKLDDPKPTVDVEAMKMDPIYRQLQKTWEDRTLFLAQQMGQEG